MAGRDYLLRKPAGPSRPRLFLDTQLVPVLIDAAGGLEVALDRAATRTGLRPAVIVAGVAGLASLALVRLVQTLGPGRRHP